MKDLSTTNSIFAKGSTHNCFWILHLDVYKELNDPDDPELRGANIQLKAWIRENNIKLPEVALEVYIATFQD